jgi:putative Mg2+ transporter-C (MgtC) family protein
VEQAGTERRSDEDEGRDGTIVRVRPVIDLRMRLVGPPGVTELLTALSEQPGVLSVDTGDIDSASE